MNQSKFVIYFPLQMLMLHLEMMMMMGSHSKQIKGIIFGN
jgi:hypothetical protein